MSEFDRLKARKDKVIAQQAESAVRSHPAFIKLLETVQWITSQQNLFFAECLQAEEIVFRCKEALGAAQLVPSPAPQSLLAAVRSLYYAGVWRCDRLVDEAALWIAVRDAAGFKVGESPNREAGTELQAIKELRAARTA